MAELAGEALLHIGPLPLTNTLIDTLIRDALIIAGIFALRNISLVPGTFQNIVELAVDGLYGLTAQMSPKHVGKIFPWFMTYFIVIFLTNWSGLVPGFGTIGFYEGKTLVPYLRAATSDINTTVEFA